MNKLSLLSFEDQARHKARLYLLTHNRPQELTEDAQAYYQHLAQQQGKTLVPAGQGRFEIH